jgi:cell division protein FtsZ
MIYTLADEKKLPDIRIYGVGGAGKHILKKLSGEKLPFQSKFVDTFGDPEREGSMVLGDVTTNHTQGTGCDIFLGRKAAIDSCKDIRESMNKADLVIILGGLGGGLASGAIPVFARIADELSIPSLLFLTEPFPFEGGRKKQHTRTCLDELADYQSSIIKFSHTKLLKNMPANTRFVDAMQVTSDILASVLKRFLSFFSLAGLINIDFADLRSFLGSGGQLYIGESINPKIEIADAVNQAMTNHYLGEDALELSCAESVIGYLEVGIDFNLGELHEFGSYIESLCSEQADVFIGITIISEWSSELRVTIMARSKAQPVLAQANTLQLVRSFRSRSGHV